MRIVRWQGPGAAVAEGIVHEDRVVPFPAGVTVQSLLEAGLPAALRLAPAMIAAATGDEPRLADVRLLPPLVPASVRDFVAFEEHVEGMTAAVGGVPPEWYEFPTFYFSNPHTIVPHDGVVVPPATAALDFELEVAAIVGALPHGGVNLTPSEGAAAIFGYTIMNDWSARDVQNREMQVRLGPAKGKDFGTSLGPWIVTADEVADFVDADGFLALRVVARVNGAVVGEDLLSNMSWPFGELVAYASRNARIIPGDVLGSGTAGNGGCLGELWGRNGEQVPPALRQGDVVSLTVEAIGELRGVVGAGVPVPEIPRARIRDRRRS